ncbi:hypothetical protein ACWKSP_38860 [Micromonosporaceae bacterium Da 78-11]
MTRPADPPALITGCHLYEGPDGIWRYYLPGDEFVRITAPPAVLRATRTRLHGHPADGDPEPGVPELIAALGERGVLAVEAQVSRRGRILVTGTGPVADEVHRLLAARHDVVAGKPEALDGFDVVVSCAGWLPDTRWCELAAACAKHEVAWHGCHAEGGRWFAGPLAVPGRTAGYLDTRARRLGACGVPQEMLAYWAYLDAGVELPPVPWPAPGATALIAGLITADIDTYLTTGSPAAEAHQLEVDPGTLAVTAHPVLPLPYAAGTAS